MLAALLALALAADPPLAPAPAAPPPATGTAPARRPRTVAGKISAVELGASRLTLEVADGAVPLSFDRNTMVFLETRLGTPRDLTPGMPARASLGPSGVAYWIELRPRGVVPTPRSGEGAPPSGPAAAPAPATGSVAVPPPADRSPAT